MMRFLDRFSLEARFLLALGLPLVVIIWMTTMGAVDRHREVSNLREVEMLTRMAVQAGNLVHHLQVERGLSQGYLGSQGGAFHDALPAARAATDHQFSRLRTRLNQGDYSFLKNQEMKQQALLRQFSLPGDALGTEESLENKATAYFWGNLEGIINKLEGLSGVRQRIDGLSIRDQEALDYYTQINLKLSTLTASLIQQTRHAEIARKLAAYHAFMMYKELAGLERARVSHMLTGGTLTAAYRHDLLELWGEQRAFYTTFLRLADMPYGEQLLAAQQRHTHPERASLRQTLRESNISSDASLQAANLPTAEEWFIWQTDYIDQLKVVEDAQAAAIMSWAIGQREAASFVMWRYLVISPLSILIALLLLYLIVRSTHLRLTLADTIFHHTHDGITVTDHQANIIDTNRAFTAITGYVREEVEGQNPRILQSGRQGPDFYREMWQQLITTGTWQGEIWNRRKNGELYAEFLTISAVHDKSGKPQNYIAIFSDITSQTSRHQQQLELVTYYDSLTGLPNRTLLIDRLRHALHTAHRDQHLVAIAVINLDDFKVINKNHGYAAGDQILEIMAKRFQTLLRESDTLARLGGNEFAVIMEDVASPQGGIAILERLHQKAGAPISLNDCTLTCSASIGTTCFPLDSGEAETLLRHAHQALLQAKLNGRNRIQQFDLREAEQQSTLSRLVQRLELALANDELVLHYQPKVDMVSGELLGAEALLRWEDPERGMVPPGEFLPYLEHHPIAITIGHWVIETALAQMAKWQRQGTFVRISVNVSAQELHHPDFVKNLRSCLAAHPEFPNDQLDLEILENAAIGDIKRVSHVLSECRSLGITISLDDFGTGYASLDYLKHIPADTLKIDQTFVRDMLTDSGDQMIVKAIIGLADTFDFDVIAEGVENEEQGLALIEMGCQKGQGFGIGRPMPADAFFAWHKNWQVFESWKNSRTTNE
ncbi:MAG: EAL domain-containing protein [Pseudomonadota bacterium]